MKAKKTKNGNLYSKYLDYLKCLDYKDIFKLALKYLFSINHFFILDKNIRNIEPLDHRSRYFYQLSEFKEEDLNELNEKLGELRGDDRKELIVRLLFLQAGFKNCYIARNKKGEIVHIQWLVYPHENNVIRENYSYRFLELKEKQVMLENALTFPKYRGLGLLSSISQDLLKIASKAGYQYAISYIRKDVIRSLTDFINLGFKIRKLVPEYKFLVFTWRKL